MEKVIVLTAGELAEWLHRAKAAHAVFEEQQGEPDQDWPEWYANYIGRQVGHRAAIVTSGPRGTDVRVYD